MAGPIPCGTLYLITEDAQEFLMLEDGYTHLIAEQEARSIRIGRDGPVSRIIERVGTLYDTIRRTGKLRLCE